MDLLSRLGLFWRRLNPNQRLLFGTLGLAFVVVVISLGVWSSRPQYGTLFANLDPADGSAIVDQLRSQKIPYKVADGGRTIQVPEDKVYETRLSMAGNGLPGSGTGYEILDTNKLGWTDFMQKFQYRRALEGEIARTIQTLQEIQAARVHLVTPEPSLFIAEEKQATASVVLRLKPGARLSAAHVQGIVHLVSSAVEGLGTDNVTIIDTAGNLLSRPSSDPLLGATADQISLARGMEEGLTNKVQSLLETVLGPGKSAVRISAEMDFQKAERTVESYDAENPVIRSEETHNQTGTDGSKNESSTTNYEISKTVEHVVAPTGQIRRLTASVFVDGTYRALPKGQKEYVPRSPEEMQKFQNIIKTALGFDAKRGDQLTVESIAFDTSVLDQEKKEMEKSQRWTLLQQVGGKVLTGAVLLFLFLFLVRAMRKMRGPAGPVMGTTTGRMVDMRIDGGSGQAGAADFLPEPAALENPRSVQIQKKVMHLAKESPDNLARLLRVWLREEA
jgi:flagellar M-ring protein FliF